MKNLVTIIFAFFLPFFNIKAQCTITASAPKDTVVCGDCQKITVFGRGQGNVVFTENFNSGAPTGWAFTQQATFTNPCSPNGVDGTKHIWMGSTSAVPRSLETNPYNFSGAVSGATVCFDMLFATQGNNAPCEGPDEPDEGVYLQYRIGNGSWVTIHYFDPNGGNDQSLINWNNWCFQLPQAALTSNVSIRWFQDNDSGADYDHWGIDNVAIYFNDPTFTITASGGGLNYSFPQGSSGGEIPQFVCPKTNTIYTFSMTNTQGVTCSTTYTLYTKNPQVIVSAEKDTTICEGNCVRLNGIAKVVKSPAKVPTYRNNEVAVLSGLPSANDITAIIGSLFCTSFTGCTCQNGTTVPFGGSCPPPSYVGSISMNINITDLNTSIIQNGQILRVCVGSAIMTAGNFTPFAIILKCPSGDSIVLSNPGNITGNNLQGACFDFAATTPIAQGAPNYTGNWQSVESFNNLSGCSANGVWTLTMRGTFTFSNPPQIPVGFLNGWSITFNDPEISYPANFSWSPTANMTGANTLTPLVCPTSTQSYLLTSSDTANCVTVSDNVAVNVQTNCCNFNISATAVQPVCGASNGSISLTSTPAGNYSFLWNDGNTNSNRSGLAAGVYSVSVTDLTTNCVKDTSYILSNPNGPVVDSFKIKNVSCNASNDGAVTVFASSPAGVNVAAGFNWSNDNDSTDTQTDLVVGNYFFTVTDLAGCKTFGNVQIAKEQNCCPFRISATANPTTCSANNGAIQVSVISQGLAPYEFSLNGTSYQQSASFSNLSAGSYIVYALDKNGCGDTVSVVVGTSSNTLTLNFNVVEPGCSGANSGSIEALVSGGSGSYSFEWNNGSSSNPIGNLSAGTYTLTVTDGKGCTISQSVTLNPAQPFSISIGNDTSFCSGGSAVLNAPAGFTQYVWSNGETVQSINVASSDVYSVTVTNASGCTASASVAVSVNETPIVSLPNDTTVYDNNPVRLSPSVLGNTNGVFKWEPDVALSCSSCKEPIAKPDDTLTYVVTFTDGNGCSNSDSITINVISGAKIFMPNAFTPNADGNNDILFPKSIGVKEISWKVYNRWGELVFETNDLNVGWDGTYKGSIQPSGVYVYTMKVAFRNNTNNQYKGSVSLVR